MFNFGKPKLSKSRVYNWSPEIVDQRDFMYRDCITPAQNAQTVIPSSIDIRNVASPIKDQQNLGSCVFNSAAELCESVEIIDKKNLVTLSRLFPYWNARKAAGTVNQDSGAFNRDAIKVLAQYGNCSEKTWPYIVTKFTNKPSSAAYKEALTHTIKVYMKLNTIDDIKHCLASKYPVMWGFSIFQGFENVDSTGIVPMPGPNDAPLGGHSTTTYGYDDNKGWFIGRNHWSSSWGDKGYYYIPYEYITKFGADFWTIRNMTGF